MLNQEATISSYTKYCQRDLPKIQPRYDGCVTITVLLCSHKGEKRERAEKEREKKKKRTCGGEEWLVYMAYSGSAKWGLVQGLEQEDCSWPPVISSFSSSSSDPEIHLFDASELPAISVHRTLYPRLQILGVGLTAMLPGW